MSWFDPIFEGDLVTWRGIAEPGANALPWIKKYAGQIGIVTERRPRWPDNSREDEMIITVFYPDSGTEEEWSDMDLEVISESR